MLLVRNTYTPKLSNVNFLTLAINRFTLTQNQSSLVRNLCSKIAIFTTPSTFTAFATNAKTFTSFKNQVRLYSNDLSGDMLNTGEPRPRAARPPPMNDFKVYVGNLAWTIDDQKLMDIFGEHKPIKAFVVKNREDGRSRGFGFVEFRTPQDRDNARSALDQTIVQGRAITVRLPLNREPPVNSGEHS